ncbi:MAG: hypothetical protein WC659_02220 [Patescibacteria group bacterium]
MSQLIRFPGMVDMHVHMREPGMAQKEDWLTGTSAAVAGGVVAVVDMPNTIPPTFTSEALDEKEKIAREKALCDYGFYFGSDGSNLGEFEKVYDRVLGLKLYLDETTGAPPRHSHGNGNPDSKNKSIPVFSGSPIKACPALDAGSVMTLKQGANTLLLEDEKIIKSIFRAWPRGKPILVHAEGEKLARAIILAQKNYQKLHCCHIATKKDIEVIAKAKMKGISLTCEVSPHHLFLTNKDRTRLGSLAMMKPELGTEADQQALWNHIQKGTVDCIATDHAPHTLEEKLTSDQHSDPSSVPPLLRGGWGGPWGVPGLETAMPLLLTAVEDGKLTHEELTRLTNINPCRILGIRPAGQTYVEVETGIQYQLDERTLKTKCGWSPFADMTLKARVARTIIRGVEVYKDGKIVAAKGVGRPILSSPT